MKAQKAKIKEMKAQKAKMRQMKTQKGKMKGKEGRSLPGGLWPH